jgi:23S rRNA A1618 N6-methylase RlmF
LHNQLEIIRRNWIIQRSLVAPDRSTVATFVNHDPTLLARMFNADRLEHSAAITRTVAWKFIDMQTREALRAMVAN